jgi:hypothetical protein
LGNQAWHKCLVLIALLIPADNFVITRFSGKSVSHDLLVQVAHSKLLTLIFFQLILFPVLFVENIAQHKTRLDPILNH